ncbi:MAG: transposase, partial [Spirochaetales bacterium]|nr:transposase [Spirochaetales bacterium]
MYLSKRPRRFSRPPVDEKDKNLRRHSRNLYAHKDFIYKADKNHYVCPAGKFLRPDGKTTMHGHVGRRYIQKDGDCTFCYLKSQCLRKNSARRNLFIVEIPKEMTFSEKMKTIIDSDAGRQAYSKRMGIVEPVFANITHNKGLKRFQYRGLKKVNTVWLLYSMVHNIEK